MKDPLTMQDEQSLRAQREFERTIRVLHARAQAKQENDEQAAWLTDWNQRNPPKSRRATTWKDVRAFIGALLVLALMLGGGWWFLAEWTTAGGWLR